MKVGRAWRRASIAIFLVAIPWQAALAGESWYRWVDPKGEVHIQRDTPGSGIAYDIIELPDTIPWRGRPDLPAEIADDSKRSTQDLFKRASQSIYLVLGARQINLPKSDPVVYGSAVAISENALLTNCHVTQAAGEQVFIGLPATEKIFKAELVARDQMADRCVLAVSEIRLRAVAGVRRYDTLEIGESVYAIGNPARLERTLSDGLLSGKRVIENMRYLQTTAPISPGSSGGGLFDAHGNLVGITTMTLRGTQNINFAIPAEDFWK